MSAGMVASALMNPIYTPSGGFLKFESQANPSFARRKGPRALSRCQREESEGKRADGTRPIDSLRLARGKPGKRRPYMGRRGRKAAGGGPALDC